MKTIYSVLAFSLLLLSCQADLEYSDTEQLSTADATFKAKEKSNANNNSEESQGEPEAETSGAEECETAFAMGDFADCFLNHEFSRWGWVNGPYEECNHKFDIYAGAGQCDTGKGAHVGTLTVEYDGAVAKVSFELFEGYTMSETHVYIGNAQFPLDNKGRNTVAPGQFPYKHDLDGATSDYFEVEITGEIYVIAHAVVCGSGDGEEETETGGDNDTGTGTYTPS